jgi:hypothetical protein
MHERPIGDLVDALRQLGCHIDYLGNDGYPPLRIAQAAGVPALSLAAPIRVRGDVSSQFLTALLMALPLAAGARRGDRGRGQPIRPYIHITPCSNALASGWRTTTGSVSPSRRQPLPVTGIHIRPTLICYLQHLEQ